MSRLTYCRGACYRTFHYLRRWSSIGLLFLPLLQWNTVRAEDTPSTAENVVTASTMDELIVVGEKNGARSEPTELTELLLDSAGTTGDPFRALFTRPGVVQIDDEDAEPSVRGSAPNDNLFMIDGQQVGFLFHPFGDSIFDENLIHDFGFRAAGFGASYGEATGGVFDVGLRDPRNHRLQTTLDLSTRRLGVVTEGGIGDDQAFYFSYRESLLPLWLHSERRDEDEDTTLTEVPRATDYQAKYQTRLQESKITFLAIGARDKAAINFGLRSDPVLLDPSIAGDASLTTVFHNQSVTWENDATRVLIAHNDMLEDQLLGSGEFLMIDRTGWQMRLDQSWQLANHDVVAGLDIQQASLRYDANLRIDRCTQFSTEACDFERGVPLRDARSIEERRSAVYLQDAWQFSRDWRLTTGVRASKNAYLDEQTVDPRIRIDWTVNDRWSAHASVGRYHRQPDFQHIVPVYGTPELVQESADHAVLGLSHQVNKYWSWSMELYYKDLNDLVIGSGDDSPLFTNRGAGKAYGAEFLLEKGLKGGWYGWLSASFTEAERTNEATGDKLQFEFDVPVVVNAVYGRRLSNRWTMNGRWTYRSGRPFTPILGNQVNPDHAGFYIPVYGELNSARAAAFHRLDLRFEREFRSGRGSWFVDISNVYGRENVVSVEYEPVPDSNEFRIVEEDALGLFPFLGVKLIFGGSQLK